MRVLVFTTLFPNCVMPNHAVFVKERILNLSKLCDIKIIAPVPYFPKLKLNKKWFLFSQIPLEEKIEDLHVYHPRYFITPKIFRCFYGIFMFLSVINYVKKIRKEFDFDLIDAHFAYPDGLAAILLGKVFKRKVIITVRGTDINWYPKFRIIRKFIQYTLKSADFVISVSKNLKEKVIKLGIDDGKIKVIPNGVDLSKFFPVSKLETRKKNDLPSDKKIILSVGRLVESKGFNNLIRAIKETKRPDLYLIIIGEGPYRNRLEELIRSLKLEDQIKLLGEKSYGELHKWYSVADLFCLASLREGCPNTVLEALACGIPVIIMKEWQLLKIVNENNSILLSSNKPEEIAKAIEKVLKREWDKERISIFMQHFNWNNTAEAIYAVFDKVLKKRDILFFSSDDWDSGLKTSKYHIAKELAKKHKVIFIESLGLRKPQVGKKDFIKILQKLNKWIEGVKKVHENLYVYTPLVIPYHANKLLRSLNGILLKIQIMFIMKRMKTTSPIYWTFLPNTVDILKHKTEKLVYYCVDNMTAFKGVNQDVIGKMDEKLTSFAKVVFAVSEQIYRRKKILNENTYYVPHGVNYEHFAGVLEADIGKPAELSHIGFPIIGFYGLISEDWIDFNLLSYIADFHPEWSIVMVGKIDINRKELPERKNIHYLGPVSYEDLPSYAKFFDIAIIPFNVNELTMYSNPLKVYEYLAMGKPVVSVDIPEISRLGGMVEIAKTYKEFVRKIEKNLKEKNYAKIRARIEFAKDNSWEKKVEQVWDVVEKYI